VTKYMQITRRCGTLHIIVRIDAWTDSKTLKIIVFMHAV